MLEGALNARFDAARIATEFSGFADLRRLARGEDPEAALREVARQFEALFLKMMLKSMREASPGDPLLESSQAGFYRDLHDSQLALKLAGSGGLGLAEMMVRQLRGSLPPAQARDGAAQAAASRSGDPAPVPATPPEPAGFGSRRDFVQALWPHAVRAAGELGTTPGVLIAQAALETGWGRAVHARADGRSSYNLFNIKADARWDGERVRVSTLEYEDGVAVRRQAEFRAYGSWAESFDDYVALVKGSPRYRTALERAPDPEAYIEALHEAGYATDPDYAAKVRRVLDEDLVAAFREDGGGTLT